MMSNYGARFGPPATTTVRCRYCTTTITVPPNACAVQCVQCHCVTRVVQRYSSRIPPPPMPNPSMGFPCVRGNKRAVLIGITYAGMRHGCGALSGPINDVKCMRQLLCQRYGFPGDSIIMLTAWTTGEDDHKNPSRLPTKDNIRMAMHWLVQGCRGGDSLVFHFSGRGVQVPDHSGDEVDGCDEAICPVDSYQNGPILDDEINEAIVRPLVPGAKLHAVVDACHSATVLDLPFQYRVSRYGNWQWEDHRPPTGACKGTSGGQAVLISGHSDGKSNIVARADAYGTIGAMTHSFIKAVECEPRGLTYGRLLTSMASIMRSSGGSCNLPGQYGGNHRVFNFSGVKAPELSASEIFDVNCKPFVL
ncbi:hypothetical protein ACP70R_048626 [Stipagrostis hirtigluma subsp. patula]